jgi:hypothetical protein
MNLVVTATLILKLVTCVRSSLQGDELHDVRVIDPENAHVRAAPRASLLHRVGGGIIELHERDWTARDPGRRADHRSLRAQAREREAGTATALMMSAIALSVS